jgi:peptidoglycan/LPS O-acetylase OafA/YrhL
MNSASAASRTDAPNISASTGKAQVLPDSSARRGHGGYRADIEGLRGVAVILVVLFHAGVWGMRGGFTGVDVFFVLSGYLITDLLVREIERSGTISFVQFYARRTRRLLPAAVLVLGVTVAVGALVFSPVEQGRYMKSALATSMYVSNVQFLRKASQYFAADLSGDPFLHTWSLAVEEQFYLVWPALILLGFGAARSRRRLIHLIGIVSLATLAGCVWLTWFRKPWAFFASPTRAWEFGLGGLASMLPVAWLQAREPACRWLGWVGLVVILGAAMMLSGDWFFPGAWALLPVLGTLLVLLAGVGAPGLGVGGLLGSSLLQWIGRHSYSWYLWHWPVLVGAGVLWPGLGVGGKLGAAMVALGAAALSYAVVENRIRFHPYLVARPRLSLGLAGLLSVTGLSLALGARHYAHHLRAAPTQKAYVAAEWDLSDLYKAKCIARLDAAAPKVCVFGDSSSPVTVVLMGDSHAAHWFAAMQRIAGEEGWKLVSMVKAGCPTPRVPIFDPRIGRESETCASWRQASLRRIEALHPTAVVLANSLGPVKRPGAGGFSRLSYSQWEEGNRKTLSTLDSAGVRTILLRDSPRPGFDVPVCLSRAAYRDLPLDGCHLIREFAVDSGSFAAEQRAARGLSHVSLVDFTDLICDATDCPVLRDGMVVYSDDNHLTATYARSIAPAMTSRLASLMGIDRAAVGSR